MSGIEALKLMQQNNMMVPTISLTTFDDGQLLLDGMQQVLKGFL
ncbi:MAG: DNA-binding NarL/FixJ family response regulator [Sulfitobacter sp.]|jgi:DNA-binding NarL/FixJ family response regulator